MCVACYGGRCYEQGEVEKYLCLYSYDLDSSQKFNINRYAFIFMINKLEKRRINQESFPGSLVVKNLPANAGDDPWSY